MEWNLDTEEQQEVQPQEETEQELQVTAAPTDNYLQQQVNQALTSEQLEDSTLLNNERPKNFDTDQEGFWGAVSNTPKAWGTGILRQAGGFLGSLEMLPAMMYDTVSTYIQNPLADVLGIEEMKVNYQEDFRDNILNPFDTFGDTGYTIKEIGKRLSPMLETEGTFEENLANKNYDEAAEQLWYMVNENAPQIGIQLLMAAIPTTAPIGLGFIGASKAGGEWLDLVNDTEDGLTNHEEYTNAVAKGASELVATAIFSQPYFNSIFNRGTQAAFVESLRKVFSSKLGTVGISTGLNVLEENLVNVLDTLADEATGNYDTEITLEDYFKDWKATSAVAAVFGVGTGALDIAMNPSEMKAQKVLEQVVKNEDPVEQVKQQVDNEIEQVIEQKKVESEVEPSEVEKSYPIQESIEEVQARDDGLFDLEFMKTAKPLKDSEGNYLFTRIDKADSDLSASERPQGLYATLVYNKDKPSLAFADVDGDTLYRGKVKSDKVLELEATKIEHERFIKAGRDNGEVDAGVGALKELVSEERFEELRTMNKEEVEAEIIKEYPDYEGKLDIEGAGDAYDLLSAYGAIKAREAGYTAIVNESAEVLGKDTSEIAILNEENVEWGWNEEQTDTTPTDDQIEGTTEETTVEKSPEYEELARIAKTSLTPETFMNRVFVEEEVDFNILSELEIDTTQEARAFFDEATNGGTEFEIEDTRPSYDDQISEYTTRLDEIQDKRTKEARKLKNQIAELENLKEIDSLEEPEVDQRLEELEAQMEEVDLRTKEGRALKKQKKALDSMKYKFKRDRMFDRQIQEQVTNFYKARRVSEEQATAYANDLAENGVTVTDDMKQEITSALTPKQGYAMNLHRITDVDPKVRALINEVADMTKDSTTKTMKSVAQTVETALQAEDSIEQGYKVSKLIEELQIEADRVPRHQKLARFAREVIVSNAKVLTEMAELISNAAGTVSEIEYAMFAQRVALQHTLTHNLDRLVGNAARTLSLQRAMVNGEMVDMSTLTPQQIASSPDAQTKTKDLVDSFGGTKNIQKLAQKIASKKDGSLAELNEAMTEVSKYHKVLDALIEYRSSNVLMNVSTHATNVISQTGRILLDDFINFISATYNSVLGYEEAMTFAKAKAQLLGHLEGIINAFRNPIVSMKQAGETVLGKAPSTFDLVMLALRNPTKFEQIREATNFGNDRATMEGINKHAFSAESLLSKEFREGSLGSFIGAALDYYGAMSRNIAFGGLQAGDAPFSSAGYYHALAGQLYDLQKNLPDEVNGVPKRDYLKSLKDKVVALRKLRTLDPYIQRDILIEEGLNGDTGKSRTEIESEVIEKYIGDTLRGVKPDEMIKIADLDQTALQHSKEVTWKDDFAEGTLGRSIEKFAHAHKEVKLLQMFIHTPLKIFAYAFRNTPLSPTTFKNLLGTNGKAAQIQAFGAVTSTVLIIGAGLALYSSNNLTPSARDYKERERMYQAGVVPNSFRIGDKWYSFNRIEPLSYYLSTAANGARAAHEAWADPDEDSNLSDRLLSTVGQTAGAMMSTMLDKNYFKGLQDFVAMVQGDGSKYYAGNLVASFVPTYTLRRNIYDYTYGGANPFYDKYLRTDSGLVRRDVYGKPIAHYKTPTGMNPTPMTESLIRQETYDLGLNLSGFGRAIGGVILNEAQQNELRRYFDEELKAEEQMNRFVSSASYQKIPTAEAKRDAIRKVWLKLKGQARKSLFRDPEYLKEYQKNIQKPETQGYYEDMFRGKGTGTIRKPKINFVKQIETFKSEE